MNFHDANKQLSHMYWPPKHHKTPSKATITVTAAHCSVKPLS